MTGALPLPLVPVSPTGEKSSFMSRSTSSDDEPYDGGAPLSRPFSLPSPPLSFSPSTSIPPGSFSGPTTSTAFSQLSRTASAPIGAPVNGDAPTPASPPPVRTQRSRGLTTSGTTPSARYIPLPSPPPSRDAPRLSRTSPSLQSHLYASGLLSSSLADVHLLVFGRLYSLHRIVLGQAGFFRSLLEGGFVEARADGVISVELGPPLSRIAFECCLASLYGGGPELVPPPWANASPAHPLSEYFEKLWLQVQERTPFLPTTHDKEEKVGQEAPPEFALSLLATATYLEIPQVQQRAFDLIMATLTPWTVCTYLGFALGRGTGPHPILANDQPLLGLEGVGALYNLPPSRDRSRTSTLDSIASSLLSSSAGDYDPTSPNIFVGPEGVRVGEACACWLSKWSSEVLAVEEFLAQKDEPEAASKTKELRLWRGLPAAWIRALLSSDAFFLGSSVIGQRKDSVDGGTGPDGEWERYCFAKRVVELRRKDRVKEELVHAVGVLQVRDDDSSEDETGGDGRTSKMKCGEPFVVVEEPQDMFSDGQPSDEEEYARLFETGIHYSHLTFTQLRSIAKDLSPSTGLPYVSQPVLERALWLAQDFRSRIPVSPTPFGTSSHSLYEARSSDQSPLPTDEKAELGLSSTINPTLDRSKYQDSQTRPYYLIPVDDTCRVNDGPLVRVDPPAAHPPKVAKPTTIPAGEAGFFSLALETRLGVAGGQPGVFGTHEEQMALRRFAQFEPCRFSAEFWGVGDLREKQRLYSETFFLGGSYYNLYLQKIQKNGVRLGIYLHRQNQLELFPAPSRPPLAPKARSLLPGSLLADSLRESSSTGPTLAPYVDRRTKIQAYFSIWCPNQLGTGLTKFSSAPDSFALSQSWGWKSSSLGSEEYLGSTAFPTGPCAERLAGRFNSLRVTLLMGLI